MKGKRDITDLFTLTALGPGETLQPDDAGNMLEELVDAQNKAHLLALMLKMSPYDVEAIQEMYPQPKDRLLHVIRAFLEQEPNPTWRVIITALRTRIVNLPRLARRLELVHFPNEQILTIAPGMIRIYFYNILKQTLGALEILYTCAVYVLLYDRLGLYVVNYSIASVVYIYLRCVCAPRVNGST